MVIPASPQAVVDPFDGLNICIGATAYESGPMGFSLARMLQDAGIPVIVAAPSKIPRSGTPGAKSDRLDCLNLSNYAAECSIHCHSLAEGSPTGAAAPSPHAGR